MPYYSSASSVRLRACAEPIPQLFNEVIKEIDCTIVCGLRTTHEQQILYAQGRTMPGPIVTNCDGLIIKSKHQLNNRDECTAVDVVPYPIDWNDRERFILLIGVVKGIASQMGIEIISGLDWDSDYVLNDQSFFDLPHWELPPRGPS